MKKILCSMFFTLLFCGFVFAQKPNQTKTDEKVEAIVKKAVEMLGGENYLQVKSQIGRGKFSLLSEGAVASFQSFTDVVVYPDKERTDFKGGGVKSVQTNFGNGGWVLDAETQFIKDQNAKQIENFRRGRRASLDNLLRGNYRRDNAVLSYVGKRQAGVGVKNEVVKLTYDDGFAVEFEFKTDGLPAKAIYKRPNGDGEAIIEEDRYAQFVEVGGINTPFIIDHFTNNAQISRINYQSIEYNQKISDSIFEKPKSAKDLKKL